MEEAADMSTREGKDTADGASDRISTSYGGVHMGLAYGSGYGKEPALTEHADRMALVLNGTLGLPIVKRGNADGRSCGAHYDGHHGFGANAKLDKDDGIVFSAYFKSNDATLLSKDTIAQDKTIHAAFGPAPSGKPQQEEIFVISKAVATAQQAIDWLLTTGRTYCPAIRQAMDEREERGRKTP